MKRLLFVLAFTFIGQQAFSQMYIVTLSQAYGNNHVACSVNSYDPVLSIVAPNGTITYTCLTETGLGYNSDVIGIINQELNSIINQGYKLIETNNGQSDNNGFISDGNINYGTTWYFAIP
jgi:hypothetical protein